TAAREIPAPRPSRRRASSRVGNGRTHPAVAFGRREVDSRPGAQTNCDVLDQAGSVLAGPTHTSTVRERWRPGTIGPEAAVERGNRLVAHESTGWLGTFASG